MADKKKDYILLERDRNECGKPVYTRLLMRAFPGAKVYTMHHIVVVMPDEVVHEIPSADTLIFDHNIMGVVFGESTQSVLSSLARCRGSERDSVLNFYLTMVERGTPVAG